MNPHSIVRMTIEELTQVPTARNLLHPSRREPVFLGLEERRKEKLETERAAFEQNIDVLEIDLDEDGPLREEYLPKRRVSGAGSTHSSISLNGTASKIPSGRHGDWATGNGAESGRPLPPPAKWSPAGDEPILRERTRVSGDYLAVRPPLANSAATFIPYELTQGHQNWGSGVFIPIKPSIPHIYESTFNPYPLTLHVPVSHARSHSLYNQNDSQLQGHLRSQSQFDHWFGNMTADEHRPGNPPDARWPVIDPRYGYPSHDYSFAPRLGLNCQAQWLKA